MAAAVRGEVAFGLAAQLSGLTLDAPRQIEVMYCPECRAEYRKGFTVCADCHVALVAELPAARSPAEENFVTVFESSDPALVAAAESLLQDAEIEYFLINEQSDNLVGGIMTATYRLLSGVTRIETAEPLGDRALEILSGLPDSQDELEAEE